MKGFVRTFGLGSLAAAALAAAPQTSGAAVVEWEPFIIRTVSGAVTPVAPVESVTGQGITVNIDEAGEKAGYGTHAFDGQTLSSIPGVSYARVDAGAPDPYVNIWITNGTNYAVIAPVANMQSGGGYTSNDVSGLDLQTLGFNIYETNLSSLDWVFAGSTRQGQGLMKPDGTPVKIADIGGLLVGDPGVYPNPPIGTGAPKNGTGFNLVFGDTQGNFVTPVPYVLENVAVPEPTSLALLGLGGVALLSRRRRKS